MQKAKDYVITIIVSALISGIGTAMVSKEKIASLEKTVEKHERRMESMPSYYVPMATFNDTMSSFRKSLDDMKETQNRDFNKLESKIDKLLEKFYGTN